MRPTYHYEIEITDSNGERRYHKNKRSTFYGNDWYAFVALAQLLKQEDKYVTIIWWRDDGHDTVKHTHTIEFEVPPKRF